MTNSCTEWVQLYYLNALFLAVMHVLLGLATCSLHGLTLYEFVMHYKHDVPSYAALGLIWAILTLVTGFVSARWAAVRSKSNGAFTGIMHCINIILAIVLITLILQILPNEEKECNPCAEPRDDACNPICKLNYVVWHGILVGLAGLQACLSLVYYMMCFRYYKNMPQAVSSVTEVDANGPNEAAVEGDVQLVATSSRLEESPQENCSDGDHVQNM